MLRYLARRILLFVPTLLGVSIVIFFVLRVLPGDVAVLILGGPGGDATFTQEEVVALQGQLGLDKPLYLQYLEWIWGLARGDLGTSFVLKVPIAEQIGAQFPVSMQLAMLSFAFILLIAIPIGVVAAVKQDSFIDYVLRGLSVLALAMPGFFVGMLVVLLLSRVFDWLPPLGFISFWKDPLKSSQQLIFPALALGFHSSGLLMRLTRTQLLEVLREDYIRTARAKGLAERSVIFRHAVRNSLIPVVTFAGFQLGILFSGTVVIELIFNLPGIGRGLVRALFSRDFPLIQVYVLYFTVVALVANLIVDFTYAWLDPRIRYD